MGSSGNGHVSIEEGIWNGAGTGARAFFIHLGGRFNTVEAEPSLPGEWSCFDRRRDLERGWYWCESVFHPSRRPFQYGRSRTLASRLYASRASANDAFSLDGVSRQAPRLEPVLEEPDRCFYIFRHPCKTTLFDSHFQKSDKKFSARVYLTWSPRRRSVNQALSGSLVVHSPHSFDRCLF